MHYALTAGRSLQPPKYKKDVFFSYFFRSFWGVGHARLAPGTSGSVAPRAGVFVVVARPLCLAAVRVCAARQNVLS